MERISQFLQEYVLATETARGVLAGPEIDTRVVAMREMFRGASSMSLVQFQEAMTTAHFSTYFADALSRMFLTAYEQQRGQWPLYTFRDTVPDFRDVKRFRLGQFGTLYKRREKAEQKAGGVSIAPIQYGVDEFARQFDVSWRVILNDDLGAIRQVPQGMTRAAIQFEDQFVSALYDNATTQATLAALGAPWAGTGRLTAANLAIGVSAMMQRTDADGNPIQIGGLYLVIPPILQMQAASILAPILVPGGTSENPLKPFIRGVLVDPYIGTSGADVPWYLFADPAAIPAVTVVRLQGFDQPWTYMKRPDSEIVTGTAPAAFLMGSFATGDIEYAVEDVIGGWDDASYVGVTDRRGIYFSSGTTA